MLTRYRRSRQRTFIPSDIVLSVYVYVNLTGQAYRIATAILGVAVDVMDFPAWRPAMRPLRIFLVIAIPVFHGDTTFTITEGLLSMAGLR